MFYPCHDVDRFRKPRESFLRSSVRGVRHPSHWKPAFAALLAAMALTGCYASRDLRDYVDGSSALDASRPRDSGLPRDAGARFDSGSTSDLGVMRDLGSQADLGPRSMDSGGPNQGSDAGSPSFACTTSGAYDPPPCVPSATGFAGVYADVCPDKPRYAVGEKITFTLRVENRGAAPVTIPVSVDCGGPDISQFGVSQIARVFCDCDYGICPFITRELILGPGENYVATETWDQREFFGPSDTGQVPGSQVREGPYVIHASLNSVSGFDVSDTAEFVIGDVPIASTCAAMEPVGSCPQFAPAVAYTAADSSAPTGATGLAAADLDGDGDVDLAVGNSYGGIRLLANDGRGSFVNSTRLSGPRNAGDIAIDDLDADGRMDIAVVSPDSAVPGVFVHFADGMNGGFRPVVTVPGAAACRDVDIVDLDGDGRLDLLAACASPPVIEFHRGLNVDSFVPAVSFASSHAPAFVDTADFDHDGRLDVVITSPNGGLVIRRGTGGGRLTAESADFDPSLLGNGIVAADFDCDSRLEVATSVGGPGVVGVYRSDGSAGLSFATLASTVGSVARSVAVADINHDGRMDLVASSLGFDSASLSVFPGFGNGRFGQGVSFAGGMSARDIAIADFDRDGRVDIATSNVGAGVSVLLNRTP